MNEARTLREAAEKLVAALDACLPALQGQAVFMHVHGQRYDGPTYGVELENLRTVLHAAAHPPALSDTITLNPEGYIVHSHIVGRDGENPFLGGVPRLNAYAIVPLEDYQALRGASPHQERAT